MAKFKNDNLDLETGEHIDFDDADTIQMGYDGNELYLNSTLSGVRAAQPYHMVRYDQLTEVSGTLQDQIDNFGSTSSGTMYPVEYTESPVVSSTTSTTYQQKATISSTVDAGTYLLMWYYEWNYQNGNFFFQAQVQQDNTTNLMTQYEAPGNVANWSPASGFKRLTLSNGSYTFDLDFASSQLGKQANIREARLELWRLE